MDNIYYLVLRNCIEHKRLVCGRTGDIRVLLSRIYAGKNIALLGDRRIGKTLVLYLMQDIVNRQIAQYQDELIDKNLEASVCGLYPPSEFSWHAIYLSCRELFPITSTGFLGGIVDRMSDFVFRGLKILPRFPSCDSDVLLCFQSLHGQLPERQRVVILIDEVEALSDVPPRELGQTLGLLRSVMHACPQFHFVLSGTGRWDLKIANRSLHLFNHLERYYLRIPEPTSLENYLIGYLTKQLGELQEEVTRTIVEWSGYRPYYIQAACREITRIFQENGGLPDGWKQEVEKRIVRQLQPVVQAFFESDNPDSLTRKILVSLACMPGLNASQIARKLGTSEEKVTTRIEDLLSLGKIYEKDARYYIAGKLLNQWGQQSKANVVTRLWRRYNHNTT